MDTAALPIAPTPGSDGDAIPRARRSSSQLGRSQESAVAALRAVASYLDSEDDLVTLIGRLSGTIAELTGARRAAFWRLGTRGTLALQPAAFGFAGDSPVHGARLQIAANGPSVIDRIIFADELDLVKGTSGALDAAWRHAGVADVKSSIAAVWRAGDRRIGAVAAYDSRHGFSPHDLWVLRLVGLTAGLLWQCRESEDDLGRTAVRLEQATAARRQLLNNIAAGGDEARRRFASALHDDSLQLLTGAELQLERLRSESDGRLQSRQVDQLAGTLRKVEDSLRRLLIDVSPETPQLPSDLSEAISERVESMRIRAGIQPYIDSRLPNDITPAIQSIVLKNVGEALNNVEKHARATRVTVTAEIVDGGVRVEIADDGTGFVAAESARIPGHIGLVAMRERAQLAGGWCHVESDPGAGTRVQFWIPLSL